MGWIVKYEEAALYWNSRMEAKKPERFYLAAVRYSMVKEALATLEQAGLIDDTESARLRRKFMDERPGLEEALNGLFPEHR